MSEQFEFQKRIEKAKRLLIQRGVATTNTVKGCTPQEIQIIENDVGVTLPAAYREFLTVMGREAGRFYEGTDMFYPALLGLTAVARNLVANNRAEITLPDDAIVFAMHQGCELLFVRADAGIDPPVYYYLEKSSEFVKKADRFSDFMIDAARDEW